MDKLRFRFRLLTSYGTKPYFLHSKLFYREKLTSFIKFFVKMWMKKMLTEEIKRTILYHVCENLKKNHLIKVPVLIRPAITCCSGSATPKSYSSYGSSSSTLFKNRDYGSQLACSRTSLNVLVIKCKKFRRRNNCRFGEIEFGDPVPNFQVILCHPVQIRPPTPETKN